MLCKRIIPCLDVRDGRVVKGTGFVDLRDAGDPAEQAARYDADGADEIALLDIGATPEKRGTLLDVVRKTAEVTMVPLTVGGGVRSEDDVRALLSAGADKVSINTAAVRDPELLARCAGRWGSQAIVVAIDAKRDARGWKVHVGGGRTPTDRDAVAWAEEATRRGAGEVLLTSMDRDGSKVGYDLELCARVADAVPVPVIASGGVGTLEHLFEGLTTGRADAALAASIFHFGQHTVREVKAYLRGRGVEVRPAS